MVVQAGSRLVARRAWAAFTTSNLCKTAAASGGHQHSRRYCLPTSSSSSEPRWRYKADSFVRQMAARVEAGSGTITYATFYTARPVTPDLCHDILMHVYRKVEALRVCFRERDGELWVADMETPKIDFQVLEGCHAGDVVKNSWDTTYNTADGPLWRVRLVVCPPDEPFTAPHVKEAFPYQYQLLVDTHHAVLDGLCHTMLSEILFRTLDSVLDGAQLDDRQIGELRDRSEVRAAEARMRESLEKDPHRLNALLEQRHNTLTRVPLITEAFGEPQGSPPDTISLAPEVLDHKLLQAFLAKCKAHKVTFNSGVTGVIGVALAELVREAGLVRDSYVVTTRHPVDTRRYMTGLTSMVWGFHSMPMSLDVATPWDAKNYFWKHVQGIDTKFRERIRNMGPVEELVLDTMLQPTIADCATKTIYDMMVSNLWSPTIDTIGSGKHIQLSPSHLWTDLNDSRFKMTCLIIGVQNFIQVQLGYFSEYITKENAAKLSKRMTTVFINAAKALD